MRSRSDAPAAAVAAALFVCVWWPAAAEAQAPAARTVLAIHWGVEEFPGVNTLDDALREAVHTPPGPRIDCFAEYLESGPFPRPLAAASLREYIARKFEGRHIDAVITSSTPALQFALEHRQALFPDAPIVFSAGTVPAAIVRHEIPRITGVVNDRVFSDTMDLALRLHPSVRKVLVLARSPAVEGYDERVRNALRRFADRVEFTIVPQQSFDGMLAAVRAAPRDSLILFARFIPDDAGANVYSYEVLRRVAEVSPVPIYGTADIYMGTGAVGGMLQSDRETGRALGAIARQILDGVPPERIPIDSLRLMPTFDWRQLGRWKIDTSKLPPGAEIRFKPRTVWEEYRSYVVITLAIVIVQAALITGLLTQRARRRRAEQTIRAREAALRTSFEQIREMTGRLIHAQEVARASVAQDLHDDVCQQLVFVSMGVATLKGASGDLRDTATQEALSTIEDDTRKVFEGLRRLSHDLHPATLRLLGLTAALRTHCAEVARHHGVEVAFEADHVPPAVHKDVAVCFFRIAQEALRNGVVHGGARRLSVALSGSGGNLDLTVADDGSGFDVATAYQNAGGLGLATMSERARVVGAIVTVTSRPGEGTTVRVRGPAEPPGRAAIADGPAPAEMLTAP